MELQITLQLCFLVLVTRFWHCVQAERCQFPSSLQDGDSATWWLYHVTYSGAQISNNTIIYMEVYGSHMSTTSLAGNDVTNAYKPFEWECYLPYRNNTFLVKHFEAGQDVQYLCLRIVQRSEHVFQTMTSNRSTTPPDCTDTRLHLDHWPYIKFTERVETHSGCPFSGGFDLDLYDRNGEYLCWDRYLTPRIECNCDHSRYIQLDFQTCRVGHNKILMEIKQDLVNIGDWVVGDHRFVIIKRADIALFWLLTLPADWSKSASGYLSADVVCSIDELETVSENLLQVNLTRRAIDSECFDFSPHCQSSGDVCNETNPFDDFYCERTCDRCTPTHKTFSERLRGQWMPLTRTDDDVHIAAETIRMGNGSQAYISSFDPVSSTYRLIEFREDGCHPAYTCLTLSPISPSVIKYKVSQGPLWSVFSKNSRCFERPEDNDIRKQSMFDLAVNRKGSSVSCQIPGRSYTILSILNGKESCQGLLYKPDCQGEEAKSFTLDLSHCPPDTESQFYQFSCLAHMEQSSSLRMVLAIELASDSIYCLKYSHEMDEMAIYPAVRCLTSHVSDDAITNIRVTQESPSCVSKEINQSISTVHLGDSATQPGVTMSAINNISKDIVSNTSSQPGIDDERNEIGRKKTLDSADHHKGQAVRGGTNSKKASSWRHRSNKTPKEPKSTESPIKESGQQSAMSVTSGGSDDITQDPSDGGTTVRPRSARHIQGNQATCFTYSCLLLATSLAYSVYLTLSLV